jgi:hypothetical protein
MLGKPNLRQIFPQTSARNTSAISKMMNQCNVAIPADTPTEKVVSKPTPTGILPCASICHHRQPAKPITDTLGNRGGYLHDPQF